MLGPSSMRKREGVGERHKRGQHRGLKETDAHYRPKPAAEKVQQGGTCGQDRADGKFCSKKVESIGYPSGNGTTKESNCGCRTEHEPEFFGPEPSSRKKGRQERGEGTERTEKCGIEQNKLK